MKKGLARLRLGLRARFVAVAGLLITTTVVSGLYSMAAFARLESFVGESLLDCETATSTISQLTTALEHEDEAAVLHFADPRRGQIALANARQAADASLAGIAALLDAPEEQNQARTLVGDVEAFRSATDALIADSNVPGGLERHQRDVHPFLRRAVARATEIRDAHFARIRQAARWARDESRSSVIVVSTISVVALLMSIAVVVHLARAVVWPLRALGASAEAMRRGDFDVRTSIQSGDELGKLADCMNRMAEEVGEFRRTNIGEVVRAKRALETTMAALPDAIFVTDTNGVISSANEAGRLLLGRGESDAAPTIDDIPLPAKALDLVRQALAGEFSDDKEISPMSTVSIPVGGERRQFVPRVVPMRVGGAMPSGVVLVLNDVTEIVRFSEGRVELVAVASHELRTPITTLRMTLLMLKEVATALGTREEELVDAALLGVDQLVGVVDEFLDLTRIEAGQLRLSYGRVDVGALAVEVGRTFAPRCEEVGVSLRVEPPAAPVQLWGDARRLRSVLTNLVDNAVKYTPRGGTIRVRAGLCQSDPPKPALVEVTVSDTGPGVRPELRNRIFEKFFRVEHLLPDADRGARGSGIGLYLARQIVEAHAGTIACTPGEGQLGTNIGLLLPVEPSRVGEES